MPSPEDAIDRLYDLPLDEFVAARNELARELRGAGERETASAVAKLPKPSRPAWAINRAVREHPRRARALLDAAAALASAQQEAISGAGRESLDQATGAERQAVEGLLGPVRAELESAGSAGPAMVDRARTTLHALAGDSELRSELEAGRVVSDREPVGFGATPATQGGRRRDKPADPDREADPEAKRRLAEASRRVTRAERQAGTGERSLERAQDRLQKARDALAAAEARVSELEDELAGRRGELDDARSLLKKLS